MPEQLRILVGEHFRVPCGGETEPECNNADEQSIIEYITEELHVDARYDIEEPEEAKYFSLSDLLKALLLRIEALEE